MGTQTERIMRSYEELRTVEDYMNEFANITGLAGELDGANKETVAHIDKVLAILSKGLEAKYKYIDKISRKWRKRQGLFSRIHDTLIERQESKRLKQELENEKILAKIEEIRKKSFVNNKINEETNLQLQGGLPSQDQITEPEVVDKIEHSQTEVIDEGDSSSVLEF